MIEVGRGPANQSCGRQTAEHSHAVEVEVPGFEDVTVRFLGAPFPLIGRSIGQVAEQRENFGGASGAWGAGISVFPSVHPLRVNNLTRAP
jgi:hypothetical protein